MRPRACSRRSTSRSARANRSLGHGGEVPLHLSRIRVGRKYSERRSLPRQSNLETTRPSKTSSRTRAQEGRHLDDLTRSQVLDRFTHDRIGPEPIHVEGQLFLEILPVL